MGRRFHLLLTAYLVSCAGTWLYRLTFPLLVLHLTGSALNAAILYALEYVPFLLLSLPGGVLADRCNQRRLLISCDLSAALVAAGIGLTVATGTSDLAVLYVAALLLACAEPLYHPAFQSIIPRIVEDAQLDRANSRIHSGENIVSLAGPLLAGVLIAVFGYSTAAFLNAATFGVSAVAVLAIGGVARREPHRAVPHRVRTDIAAAVTHITRHNPVLLAGSLLFAGSNFGIWLVQANLLYYLTEYRGMSPGQIGLLLAFQGTGAIVGAATAPLLMRRASPAAVIIRSTIAGGAATLFLVVAREPVSLSITCAAITACSAVNVVSWFTLRQRIVPRELLGRVVATTRMVAFSAIPVAAIVAGLTEEALHNVFVLFVAAGLIRVSIGLLARRGPLGRMPRPGPEPRAEGTARR